TLIGGAGLNIIYGDSGNNTLIGGSGTNLLFGIGQDTLVGGSGSNQFTLLQGSGSNNEIVQAGPGTQNAPNFRSLTTPVRVDLNFTGLAQSIGGGNTLTLTGQFQSATVGSFSALTLGPTHASVQVGTAAANNLTRYTAVQSGDAGAAISITY